MNVVEQPGLFFLDTNILIYSFDATAPEKQVVAKQLVKAALSTQRGVISTQIAQEFLNIALRKFAKPMSASEAREYVKLVLDPLCQHYPSVPFFDRALLIKAETGYSWYDSLVVMAGLDLNCKTLVTEDLHSGQVIRGMKIVNPFLD